MLWYCICTSTVYPLICWCLRVWWCCISGTRPNRRHNQMRVCCNYSVLITSSLLHSQFRPATIFVQVSTCLEIVNCNFFIIMFSVILSSVLPSMKTLSEYDHYSWASPLTHSVTIHWSILVTTHWSPTITYYYKHYCYTQVLHLSFNNNQFLTNYFLILTLICDNTNL